VTAVSNGHTVTDAEFDCPSCGYHFAQGDGGQTGGLCTPCFDSELRNAHEQAAKKRAKADGKSWPSKTTEPIAIVDVHCHPSDSISHLIVDL
jgi:hypothetical protein